MSIKRIEPTIWWSEAIIYNGLIFYTSVPINLDGNTYEQTGSALSAIDQLLARVQSNKSYILDATIFLASKNDLAEMNRAWDEWVTPNVAPVRCTVSAALMHEKYRVEIKIVAAQRK